MLCSLVPLCWSAGSPATASSQGAHAQLLPGPRWNTTARSSRRFLNEHTSKLQLIAQTHTGNFSPTSQSPTRCRAAQPGCRLHNGLGVIDHQGLASGLCGTLRLLSPELRPGILVQRGGGERHLHQRHVHGFRKEPHFIIAVLHAGGEQNGSCEPPSTPRFSLPGGKRAPSARPAKSTC